MDEINSSVSSLDTCCICLENVLIPVEPICFQCKDTDDGRMSCFSMKRLCLMCLEDYLQLRTDRQNRPVKKKCLFCPKTTYLHQTPKNKLFRVDYLLMEMDKETPIKNCPMPGCRFRDTHLKVAKHIFSECPFYYTDCECGHSCQRQEMPAHYEECDRFSRCTMCGGHVQLAELAQHMYYQHDKTKCFTCHQFVSMDELSQHILARCPERLSTCEICKTFIRHKLMRNHLRRHVVEINNNLQTILNKLREEEAVFAHVQKLLANLTKQDQDHPPS